MYLKSFELRNFRKFYFSENSSETQNIVTFACSKDYINEKETGDINIAAKTTLIVGQNNTGKTTIIKALEKLTKDSPIFNAYDFNLKYLSKILDTYKIDNFSDEEKEIILPKIEFIFKIGLTDNDNDLITNIADFIDISNAENNEFTIKAVWEVKETTQFIEKIKTFLSSNSKNISSFLKILNSENFQLNYYRENKEKVTGFKISNLINLVSIKANKVDNDRCLSTALKKVVNFRYKTNEDKWSLKRETAEKELNRAENIINESIKETYTKDISSSVQKIVSKEHDINIITDLTLDNLMGTLIKCEYLENDQHIPEAQYGLGYTNLIMIISEIVSYIDQYHREDINSAIHLISIEEPETYMHPQMQELFIKNISEAIKEILSQNIKHLNSQLIITTHSSHILNSKIHNGNTFDDINYIANINSNSKIINLSDKNVIQPKEEPSENSNELNFIKKHIKYKISEIFFADAVIFVEGITEYTLLKHYIDQDDFLSKKYISLILVNGSHAKVYKHLIQKLGIPVVIITDLDVKREKEDIQISECNIKERTTTNNTLSDFYKTNNLEEIIKLSRQEQPSNIMLSSQTEKINNFFATSFEEAIILTNNNNDIVVQTITELFPNLSNDWIKEGKIKLEKSFEIQNKIATNNKKSDFANILLYKILVSSDKTKYPEVPKYITNAFLFLNNKLSGK